MVSPLLTSFSSFFSRLRSLMVPRFRCEYTLFARFLIDGEARKVCCIIRTHSSISISLGARTNNRQPNEHHEEVYILVKATYVFQS